MDVSVLSAFDLDEYVDVATVVVESFAHAFSFAFWYCLHLVSRILL